MFSCSTATLGRPSSQPTAQAIIASASTGNKGGHSILPSFLKSLRPLFPHFQGLLGLAGMNGQSNRNALRSRAHTTTPSAGNCLHCSAVANPLPFVNAMTKSSRRRRRNEPRARGAHRDSRPRTRTNERTANKARMTICMTRQQQKRRICQRFLQFNLCRRRHHHQ